MDTAVMSILKDRLGEESFQKLSRIDNPKLHEFVAKGVELCNPDKVFVCTDSSEDLKYIRESSIQKGEEIELALEGHTIHFDSYGDQGRDKEQR